MHLDLNNGNHTVFLQYLTINEAGSFKNWLIHWENYNTLKSFSVFGVLLSVAHPKKKK